MKTIRQAAHMILLATVCALQPLLADETPHAQEGQLPSLAPIVQKVVPAVVNIKTVYSEKTPDPIQSNTPSNNNKENQTTINLASGVIVDKDAGYILTNHHVIAYADEIFVTLNNGRQYNAKLIGSDSESDVAVLQIEASDLTQIAVGDSSSLEVGDYVLAFGNPFGLDQSVTWGIISALGRDNLGIEGYENFIQTDASINPGNSGGALVNLKGELIGINTAIIAPFMGSVGISLAIPINMAESVMEQLTQYGEIRRGLLGLVAQPLTHELASAFNVPTTQQGVLVSQIIPRTLAERAGIMASDIITTVNDQPVTSASHLRNIIGLVPIGQDMKIHLLRGKENKIITITMTDPELTTSLAASIHPLFAGSEFGQIDQDVLGQGHIKGVILLNVEANSPAMNAGLRTGDIIVNTNQRPVSSIDELQQAVKSRNDLTLLYVLRGPRAFYTVLQ